MFQSTYLGHVGFFFLLFHHLSLPSSHPLFSFPVSYVFPSFFSFHFSFSSFLLFLLFPLLLLLLLLCLPSLKTKVDSHLFFFHGFGDGRWYRVWEPQALPRIGQELTDGVDVQSLRWCTALLFTDEFLCAPHCFLMRNLRPSECIFFTLKSHGPENSQEFVGALDCLKEYLSLIFNFFFS